MKKHVRKISVSIVLALSCTFLLPTLMTLTQPIQVVKAATVKLNKTKITINVGETYQLKLTGTRLKVKWSTSKKSVATVSSSGLVTGIKAGTIIVTAKVDDDEYKCIVNVVVPILTSEKPEQGIGGKTQYKINNLPKEFTNDDITWMSSNEDIITIDGNGLATTVGIGKSKITATFGSYKLSRTVTITPTQNDLLNAANNFKIEYNEIDDQIICIITNNSKIDIMANYQLEFYDETDNLVSISLVGYLSLFKNEEYLAIFEKSKKDYKYYRIKFDKINEYVHQINQKDKVSVKMSDKYSYDYEYTDWSSSFNSQIKDKVQLFDININNQSEKRVYFEAFILYYKDNNLVDYTRIMNYYDLDVGVTTIEKVQLNGVFLINRIILPEYDTCRIIYSAKTNKY